jgi:hypothetical protein
MQWEGKKEAIYQVCLKISRKMIVSQFYQIDWVLDYFKTKIAYNRPYVQRSYSKSTTDTWWLDPKLFTAQNHIPNLNRKPVKCIKTLGFCQKNGLVFE